MLLFRRRLPHGALISRASTLYLRYNIGSIRPLRAIVLIIILRIGSLPIRFGGGDNRGSNECDESREIEINRNRETLKEKFFSLLICSSSGGKLSAADKIIPSKTNNSFKRYARTPPSCYAKGKLKNHRKMFFPREITSTRNILSHSSPSKGNRSKSKSNVRRSINLHGNTWNRSMGHRFDRAKLSCTHLQIDPIDPSNLASAQLEARSIFSPLDSRFRESTSRHGIS